MSAHIIQISSGITRGRVLNGELYALRLQMLIYLHLSTNCFMKISLQPMVGPADWKEIFMTQSTDKCKTINFCNLYNKLIFLQNMISFCYKCAAM